MIIVFSKEITIKDLVKTICKKMNANYKNIVKILKDRRAKIKIFHEFKKAKKYFEME